MSELKITKSKDKGKRTVSNSYDISLDGQLLKEGVTSITLKMDAGETPKLLVEHSLTNIEIDGVSVAKAASAEESLRRRSRLEFNGKEDFRIIAKPWHGPHISRQGR